MSNARIVLIPDGDAAGERLAHSAIELLAPHRFVRWQQLAAGNQPTDYSGEEFAAMAKGSALLT